MKKVNFLEAVNSGKRFRFSDLPRGCCWYDDITDFCNAWSHGDEEEKLLEYLNNYQFEIEEKTITLTESEFDKKIGNHFAGGYFHEDVVAFKKELGF